MYKNKAFSLAEILIMLVIVGVMSVLSIQTVVAQKSQFTFICYHFYRDLKITVGDMAASTISGGLASFSCERALDVGDAQYKACVADGNAATSATPSTNSYILDYRTGTGFCKGLARSMATASAIKCSSTDLNNATLDNVYGGITKDTTENFRLMNRFLIYVSDRVKPTGSGKPYRIVTADLNGNSGPNENGKDLISFAIFDNGEVLPLGEPAKSRNYFMAVIKMRNVLAMPASNKQTVVDSMRHPAAIIQTSDRTPLTFQDAYCKVFGSSTNDPTYCSGYTNFDEKFKLVMTVDGSSSKIEVPVTICTQDQYDADGKAKQKVNGKDFIAECEFNVIKPQVSKFIPASQDVYSSKNNSEDTDEGTGEANQIYKY